MIIINVIMIMWCSGFIAVNVHRMIKGRDDENVDVDLILFILAIAGLVVNVIDLVGIIG